MKHYEVISGNKKLGSMTVSGLSRQRVIQRAVEVFGKCFVKEAKR